MWKDFQLEQHDVVARSAKQPAGAEASSLNEAVRNIQASMNVAAKGAYPSEWLLASVSGK